MNIHHMDFTVAICTYNGAKRIPEVLEYLYKQVELEGIKWEVLVVDNNSTDNTVEIVSKYAQNWRLDCQLRYVFEPVQGLAAARQKAIESAKSDLIGFLDDDNLPVENWVYEAYIFGRQNSQIGTYGSIIYPKLDTPSPAYFKQVNSLLAVNNPGESSFCYARDAKPRKVPAGAGCVVRKQAWLECVPPKLSRHGRDENKNQMAGCGEDTEALYHIQNSHWEIWHNPQMKIYHHIEPRRLERDYLLKLSRGFGLANYTFRLTRLYPWQRPFMPLLTPFYIISDGYKLISYYLRCRNQFATDIGKACEFQSRIGRFMSSFSFLK
ncbi:glycosyl transferase family 2 [Nostoc minutum NIES-26]|uniref:Glycosyl transferase family 2 n=1 Tax=Nostoc minutum NIES-26 TaxID=1844469 RepID=A0A367RE49_9NOSO|nr:glycosyl transferase family 2 [Nostoc minutum NIES-26]